MAVKLPDGLAADQIRILQEFRRRKVSVLGADVIEAIRHPAGVSAGALEGLVAKGYVRRGAAGTYEIEPKGEALAGIEFIPYYERG